MYEHIRTELEHGRQVYIICPRIFEPDEQKQNTLIAKSVVEEAKRLKKNIEEYTMEKTKIEKKKLKKVLENKIDWFMTAKEAKELGVIDEILN